MGKENKSNSTKVAFLLNLSFTILELVGGLISGSIAIIADSLHDFADSLALGLGWYFERKSEKKESNDRYTYGYKRFSMLSALINALVLILGAVYIFYESIRRIMNPEMPDVKWMIGIAVLGMVLNGIGAWKLKSGKSLNKKVLTIHLLEDTVGWLAVFIVSIILLFWDIPILDPILAIVINLAVLIFIFVKLVDVVKIFLQSVPEGVNLPLLRQKILCLDGVERVNHFHVWGLTEEKKVVTVHVKTKHLSREDQNILKQQISQVFQGLDTEHITIDLQEYSTYLETLFEDHQQRLNVLDEQVRRLATKYAEELYSEEECSIEEALERGITKAEMSLRNIYQIFTMLQVLDFTYSNVIATKAVGKLREEDMESVHSLIHRITDSGQKVRWYFEMEHFTGWDAEGLWEDLKVDLKHASDYERIAMVGDKKWQKWMTRLMKPFTAADIRYFDLSEREKARIWIRS